MNNNRAIMTYSGRMFDFWDPQPESICIEDIAHALSIKNRFNGHTHQAYSVAEHCVRMSYTEDGLPGDPLVNLLHDTAEAYVGDVVSPQKRFLSFIIEDHAGARLQYFARQETVILKVIYKALGFSFCEFAEGTKEADMIMLATEVRDLMHENAKTQPDFVDYLKDVKPLEKRIYPWGQQRVEQEFLFRYKELTLG